MSEQGSGRRHHGTICEGLRLRAARGAKCGIDAVTVILHQGTRGFSQENEERLGRSQELV